MMNNSILYKNLYIYRLAMTLLYKGNYKERFHKVCRFLRANEKNVVELCFGDIVVAEFCRQHKKKWLGIDITDAFVSYADRKGFNALHGDITHMIKIPASDVCLMVGSLYHFANGVEEVISKVLASTQRIIISEPINNFSSRHDLIGWLARHLSAVQNNPAQFRFTENTLIGHLRDLQDTCGFQFTILDKDPRDIILEIKK